MIKVSLIYVQPKGRNVTYVYESRSQWDPDKKQSRATRHLIGKLDSITNKIVKTGPRGRKKSRRKKAEVIVSEKKPNYKKLYEEAISTISAKADEIDKLLQQIGVLQVQNKEYRRTLERIQDFADRIRDLAEA